MPKYNLVSGSIHDRFLKSTAKVQIFGGGFGNGKTAVSCIKALQIANAYPGSNGLIARATLPKLNDTIRKEFIKWCPDSWIKSFPKGNDKQSSTCVLKNGSMINFRYISQQGKGSGESTTSNLLSATYDWIIVDQMEDPEISHKDFLDLLGRLRGQTPIESGMSFIDEKELPRSGPRWFIITLNPTRNWCYKKLIKPLHQFLRDGTLHPDLMIIEDDRGNPILKDGEIQPLCELFEGSTYENEDNLPADFIQTLASTYKGQMRDRFLLGKWGGYEGLVYPTVDSQVHGIPQATMREYFNRLQKFYQPEIVEGYDYGLSSPNCYLLSFTDYLGNVFLCDGFHEKELTIEQIAAKITALRVKWRLHMHKLTPVFADPAIFRRSPTGDKTVVGKSVAKLLQDEGISCQRGTNDVVNGITKVNGYLAVDNGHFHPITAQLGAPHLFIADELTWWWDEVEEYRWKKDATTGEPLDMPIDRNDHAMDATKYLLSRVPEVKDIKENYSVLVAGKAWTERELPTQHVNQHRHR